MGFCSMECGDGRSYLYTSLVTEMNNELDESDFRASFLMQTWNRMDELSLTIFPKKMSMCMPSMPSALSEFMRREGASFAAVCRRA